MAGFKSNHILIVDDEPDIVEVVRLLLEHLGHPVMVARSGGEALALLEGHTFALALVDCHMPGMDGFALAAAIRDRDCRTPAGAPLPIVAMTGEDEEYVGARMRAAGMDDYIGKPVRVAGLQALLDRRFCGDEPADVRSEAGMEPSPSAVLDPGRLAMIRAMRKPGRPCLLTRLVSMFRDSAEDKLAAMEGALARGDAPGLGEAAHALKNSAANLGADELAGACKGLEEMARTGIDADRVGACLAEVRLLRRAALAALKRELEAGE